MALNAGKIVQESNFKPQEALDPGAYPARLVQILSLGLQPQQPYQGEEKPPKQELYVTYEILDEFMKDEDGNEILDKPRWISERFPLNSLDSDLAKSTKRYLAIEPSRENGGDWSQLGGAACMVTIVNYTPKSGKNMGVLRDKVGNVSTMRAKEADKAPELVNPVKVFDIDEPDMEVFGSLPQWLQDLMTKENLEYGGSALEAAVNNAPKGGGKQEEKKQEDKAPKEEEEGGDDW